MKIFDHQLKLKFNLYCILGRPKGTCSYHAHQLRKYPKTYYLVCACAGAGEGGGEGTGRSAYTHAVIIGTLRVLRKAELL